VREGEGSGMNYNFTSLTIVSAPIPVKRMKEATTRRGINETFSSFFFLPILFFPK
jgi:hypothetical protein